MLKLTNYNQNKIFFDNEKFVLLIKMFQKFYFKKIYKDF